MKIKKELVPRVTRCSKNRYIVSVWFNGNRFRYSNGEAIKSSLKPNRQPVHLRELMANNLCLAFVEAISSGWRPKSLKPKQTVKDDCHLLEVEKHLQIKFELDYSRSYKNDLKRVYTLWSNHLKRLNLERISSKDVTVSIVREFIYSNSTTVSMPNLKRNISALIKEVCETKANPINFRKIIVPKTKQKLHRPIQNLQQLIAEIEQFDENLHLCVLFTYMMLLRPHREIRCLMFRDFNADFSVLSLDGSRVKSKRNRIVPVPPLIQSILKNRFTHYGDWNFNVFSARIRPFSNDYFKGRWSAFKKQSLYLEPLQTLYSFRHTGAIRVFEKTGSLQKLQQVMGHSDMKVSLTYLRGLEVKQLDVEDLPKL